MRTALERRCIVLRRRVQRWLDELERVADELERSVQSQAVLMAPRQRLIVVAASLRRAVGNAEYENAQLEQGEWIGLADVNDYVDELHLAFLIAASRGRPLVAEVVAAIVARAEIDRWRRPDWADRPQRERKKSSERVAAAQAVALHGRTADRAAAAVRRNADETVAAYFDQEEERAKARDRRAAQLAAHRTQRDAEWLAARERRVRAREERKRAQAELDAERRRIRAERAAERLAEAEKHAMVLAAKRERLHAERSAAAREALRRARAKEAERAAKRERLRAERSAAREALVEAQRRARAKEAERRGDRERARVEAQERVSEQVGGVEQRRRRGAASAQPSADASPEQETPPLMRLERLQEELRLARAARESSPSIVAYNAADERILELEYTIELLSERRASELRGSRAREALR